MKRHLLAASLSLVALSWGAERPNIVLIMVDDMGFSDIGCYGGEIPTPNLDKLAAGGLKFSQFYNTGRCCPTRASLLTGLYSHRAGIGWMTYDQGLPGYRGHLNKECLTIAEALNPVGYFTAMAGKWHVGGAPESSPARRGFQESLSMISGGLHFDNQTGSKGNTQLFRNGEEVSRQAPQFNPPWYGTDLWTDQGLEFVKSREKSEEPFLLYLAHVAPHFPCMAPEKTIAKYRGKFMKGWDQLREERFARQIELGLIEPSWPLTPRPEEIPAWESLPQEEQIRYDDMMAIYAAMIAEIDKSIGKLVADLKEQGEYENTLILFLSDNGGNAETGVKGRYEGAQPGDPHSNVFVGQCWAHLQNTPFRLYKHYNHEGGIASPLLAHWPLGIEANPEWVTSPAHVIDLMTTCLELSEATYPKSVGEQQIAPLPGVSLRPLFDGKAKLPARTLFWEHEGNAAARKGDWKIVRRGRQGEWELYNLREDRTEQDNLSQEHRPIFHKLLAEWEQWALTNRVKPYPEPKKRKQKRADPAKRKD